MRQLRQSITTRPCKKSSMAKELMGLYLTCHYFITIIVLLLSSFHFYRLLRRPHRMMGAKGFHTTSRICFIRSWKLKPEIIVLRDCGRWDAHEADCQVSCMKI